MQIIIFVLHYLSLFLKIKRCVCALCFYILIFDVCYMMHSYYLSYLVLMATSSSIMNRKTLTLSCLPTAITCGHPGNPANGRTNGSEFNLNDVVNFTCNTGYLLHGASRAQCRMNGQWSNPLPLCKGKKISPTHSMRSAFRQPGPDCRLESQLRLSLGHCLVMREAPQ